MMTLSGQHITLEGGNPTLADIAWGLARIPRFAGQTPTPYTVAHHSIATMKMAILGRSEQRDELAMHTLFHDAHEFATGDIPTTFKTHDIREVQRQLDHRIYCTFGLPLPKPIHTALVKRYDLEALLAEAFVVAPRATYEKIVAEAGRRPEQMFIEVVQSVAAGSAIEAEINFTDFAEDLIDRWGWQ